MVARRLGLLLLVLALLAALPASAADARRHAVSTSVGVSAREFRLAAYRTSAPRGVVRFNLANYGEDGHDLVVQTGDGSDLGRTGEVKSGRRATLTLRLAPGTYRLVCDLADHEARGMRTTFRVTR
ncbi:MAG: cupredoxin domain-containing protein [Conexibacter sp.]